LQGADLAVPDFLYARLLGGEASDDLLLLFLNVLLATCGDENN
jgi:hypothetical protein